MGGRAGRGEGAERIKAGPAIDGRTYNIDGTQLGLHDRGKNPTAGSLGGGGGCGGCEMFCEMLVLAK